MNGEIGEEDLILLARFLREMWRERSDNLYVNIEGITEHMTKDEYIELFKRIFTMNDDGWKKLKVTKKMYEDFKEKMKK